MREIIVLQRLGCVKSKREGERGRGGEGKNRMGGGRGKSKRERERGSTHLAMRQMIC